MRKPRAPKTLPEGRERRPPRRRPASVPVTESAALSALVPRLAAARVLCVGDLMLDRFLYGEVERVSPEAPVPVLRVSRESTMLGGAGNVVRNLVALGARATFVATIGNDRAGSTLATLVDAEERVDARLMRTAGRASTIKSRYLAAGQQLLRADRDPDRPIGESVAADLADAAAAAVPDCDAAVLSDYGKGVVGEAVIDAVLAAAAAHGKPVIVDPKGEDFSRYRGAGTVTPNRAELAAASGAPTDGDEAVARAARRLIAELDIGQVLVTRGAAGMSLVTAGEASHFPARAREVFDVSGAGDTAVAAFAAAIGAGLEPALAAQVANAAAGLAVGKVGTAVAEADELAAALHRGEALAGETKVVGPERAGERVDRWRRRGARIGFANGCFDLLHPGHLSLLRQARAACDRLVVGLNGDASVSRLKGPGRPVQGEAARAMVLASLECVDLVVIFAADTPLELIERLRPDVLAKGADYALSEVVGAGFVQGYGGRVLLAELERGHSTSGAIARIARMAG